MEKVPLLLKCPSNLTLMKRDCHALPRRRDEEKDTEDQIPPHLPCLPAGRLYKREELPLFGYLFPVAQAGKRGEGRFSETYILFQMPKIARSWNKFRTWFKITFFFLSC
jgi:hypothetical protein